MGNVHLNIRVLCIKWIIWQIRARHKRSTYLPCLVKEDLKNIFNLLKWNMYTWYSWCHHFLLRKKISPCPPNVKSENLLWNTNTQSYKKSKNTYERRGISFSIYSRYSHKYVCRHIINTIRIKSILMLSQ